MDRNPCLGCDLRDKDKNGRRCMECDDRVEYVSGLVGRTHASPKGFAGQDQPQQTKKENKMTILEEKVEEIIKEICAEEGVELTKLREGRYYKKYSRARRRIAETLVANYGMSKQKIGELTGVSNQAIYYLLKKNQASLPATPRQAQASPPAMPRQARNEQPATSNTVTIDFSGRKELLNHLEKYAGEEIRSVEDQIMYFIQNQLSFEEAEVDGNQG